MSTENGLERVKRIRHRIEVLRNRRVFLLARIDERAALDLPTSFFDEEVEALDWALPILEAEWDAQARMTRNIAVQDAYLETLWRQGVAEDRRPTRFPAWSTEEDDFVARCQAMLRIPEEDARTLVLNGWRP